MPRLHHTKARTGCQQCKKRKVKCDETRPKCSACKRHDVDCKYLIATVTQTSTHSGPGRKLQDRQSINPEDSDAPNDSTAFAPDPTLELRLMHEWTTQVPQSFSTAWEFWTSQAPLIAFEHRYVLDSLLCLAALHASRRQPRQWLALEGRMASSADDKQSTSNTRSTQGNARQQELWTLPSEFDTSKAVGVRSRARMDRLALKQQQTEMLRVARAYFDRALAGQNKALPAIDAESGEACYLASICVSWAELFSLGEDQDDESIWPDDPIQWTRIAHGSRVVIRRWASFAGWDWLKASGIFYGKPNMNDQASLFARQHAAPFEKLRTWALAHETLTSEDIEAYTKTVSYIGIMYKSIRDGSEGANATARRIMAMSSIVPDRWTELVEERRPRAIAMLMHVFACGELIAKENFWFRGIAKKQIPKLCEYLPTAWWIMVGWPLRVAQGDVDSEPRETAVQIDDLEAVQI